MLLTETPVHVIVENLTNGGLFSNFTAVAVLIHCQEVDSIVLVFYSGIHGVN